MAACTIALAGNPNAGKSTIFNVLTGSHQHVGNWPGKTVEKKTGLFTHQEQEIEIIDLPGIYSLSPYSLEEQIARDFLLKERPRMVVNVLDAANLERNLYLTVQIMETGLPIVMALNMLDLAQARGIQVDTAALSQRLGCIPIITTVASRGQGIAELKQAITTTGCMAGSKATRVMVRHYQEEPVA